MISLMRAIAGIGVALAVSGCGRTLVFAKVNANIAPRVQAAGQCPVQDRKALDSPDALVEMGDRLRDRIPRPVHIPPAIGLREDELRDVVKAEIYKVQSYVDDAYKVWRDAQACYDAATRLAPGNSYAFMNLGFIALKMSDLVTEPSSRSEFLTRAQTNFARAKELNRFDGQAIYYEAELHVRRENLAQAEKVLLSLLAKKWNRANVHNLLGRVYWLQGRKEVSFAAWTAASAIDNPAEATDWALAALRPLKKKRFENEEDDAEPQGYMRWDMTTFKLTPIAPPESPCGWAANGRPRC